MGGIPLKDWNRNVAASCTGHGVGVGAVGQPLLAAPQTTHRTGANSGLGPTAVAQGQVVVKGGGPVDIRQGHAQTGCNGPHGIGGELVVPPMKLIQQPKERSRLLPGHLNQLAVAVHAVVDGIGLLFDLGLGTGSVNSGATNLGPGGGCCV